MEDKKIELTATSQAIADLSEAIANLNAAVTAKKNDLKAEKKQTQAVLKEREAKLAFLKETSGRIMQNIDGIISKLDKVLESNGTSHNNN